MNKESTGYRTYIKNIRKQKIRIMSYQILTLIGFILVWELAAKYKLIDTFIFSQPSAIYKLLVKYVTTGELFRHIGISVYETILGFIFGTLIGLFIAIILWWNETIAKVLDPFLVVLNALPKTALAPILIIWAGAGISGIVVVAITISVVITILSAYNYFINVDQEKIKMLRSFNASKFQILTKLILPSNIGNMINIVKINIGMAWVGVIVGEFLVSRYGIGYLIVYGGQIFRLDLVMMGVFVLAICAWIMYQALNFIEKLYNQKKKGRKLI